MGADVSASTSKERENPIDLGNISAGAEVVLSRSIGLGFTNREYLAEISDSEVRLRSSGAVNNFKEMTTRRTAAGNRIRDDREILEGLRSAAGRALSNVGVSVALTLNVDGQDYAVGTLRQGSDRLALISGYVDSSKFSATPTTLRGELASTALMETREEILPVSRSGEIQPGFLAVDGVKEILGELVLGRGARIDKAIEIGQAYPQAAYGNEQPWLLVPAPRPAYLPSLHPGEVSIDGMKIEAAFHYDKSRDSGQLIFSYKITFDSLEGLSLLHAETTPDPDSGEGHLKEVLDPNGLVLLRLDARGIPDGSAFWLRDGKLVPRPLDPAQKLSEAFAPSLQDNGRPAGLVTRDSIPLQEYLESQAI